MLGREGRGAPPGDIGELGATPEDIGALSGGGKGRGARPRDRRAPIGEGGAPTGDGGAPIGKGGHPVEMGQEHPPKPLGVKGSPQSWGGCREGNPHVRFGTLQWGDGYQGGCWGGPPTWKVPRLSSRSASMDQTLSDL